MCEIRRGSLYLFWSIRWGRAQAWVQTHDHLKPSLGSTILDELFGFSSCHLDASQTMAWARLSGSACQGHLPKERQTKLNLVWIPLSCHSSMTSQQALGSLVPSRLQPFHGVCYETSLLSCGTAHFLSQVIGTGNSLDTSHTHPSPLCCKVQSRQI